MNPNTRQPKGPAESEPPANKKPIPPPEGDRPPSPEKEEHEGAVDEQVGDTTGPGVGYDQEPEQQRDKGGVIPS